MKTRRAPSFSAFFLYGATDKLSNVQSLCRSSAEPGALASGSSIPSLEAAATHDWGDSGCQSVCEWFGRSVSESTDRSDILQPADPTKGLPPICFSRFETAWEDALESPLNERPWNHPPGTLGTIGKQSSLTIPPNAPRLKESSGLLSVNRLRVGGALRSLKLLNMPARNTAVGLDDLLHQNRLIPKQSPLPSRPTSAMDTRTTTTSS